MRKLNSEGRSTHFSSVDCTGLAFWVANMKLLGTFQAELLIDRG
jgi:hypothetical protein